jgi:hypothetical protein
MPGRTPPENFWSRAAAALRGRPGLVTFAAVVMFLVAGSEFIIAVRRLAWATWFLIGDFGGLEWALWLWGVVDATFAIIAFYAGYEIVRARDSGRIVGIAIATFSALSWLYNIRTASWAAAIVIPLDILIIYGLAANREYFRGGSITTP